MSEQAVSDRRRDNEKVQRAWSKEAKVYDKRIGWVERRLFGQDHRPWACSRAHGNVLEVAIGTGLNLPHYDPDVRLTGIDLSPEMLAFARARSAEATMPVDLMEGDAQALPFGDESFDCVLSTFSMCNIPDPAAAIGEIERVLRPGGRLVLVDHIRSSNRLLYGLQRALEFITARSQGENFTRRPLHDVERNGLEVVERDRSRAGAIERLVAIKRMDPGDTTGGVG